MDDAEKIVRCLIQPLFVLIPCRPAARLPDVHPGRFSVLDFSAAANRIYIYHILCSGCMFIRDRLISSHQQLWKSLPEIFSLV